MTANFSHYSVMTDDPGWEPPYEDELELHLPIAGQSRDKRRRYVVRCSCGAEFYAAGPHDLPDARAQRSAHIASHS